MDAYLQALEKRAGPKQRKRAEKYVAKALKCYDRQSRKHLRVCGETAAKLWLPSDLEIGNAVFLAIRRERDAWCSLMYESWPLPLVKRQIRIRIDRYTG